MLYILKASFVFILLFLVVYFYAKPPEPPFITLASTTSTEDSGLLKAIIPQFKAKTGIDVKVVAVGTGQAFKIASSGDADALLVHDRKGEDEFVKNGFGIDRRDAMYNDFVLIGAKTEAKNANLKQVLQTIDQNQKPFTSRGDDSGTHRKELSLWKSAGLDPKGKPWYKEVGAGMGASLNSASAMSAYILADRATWASFQNKAILHIVSEGDASLLNPYGSILVNPAKHPQIKAKEAKIWHEWLTSPEGKAAIKSFRVNGEQLFYN
jgi:tungstate transport system substrate-binding protein